MFNNLNQARLAASARDSGKKRIVSIDGKSTCYWHYPAKDAKPAAKAIVFVHGYRGNHHGLEAIVGAMKHHDVYIPDLPGFGLSEPFAGVHTIEQYSAWLNAFILALKLPSKPHLLGHSFGSIVVSAYAANYSGISSLILENPVASPALKGPKAAMTALAKIFFWFAGVLPESLGDRILMSWPMVRGMSIVMTKSRQVELRRWVHSQHDANFNDYASRRVALEGYTASISNCVGDFASEIKVPTLMLIGDRDDITSVAQQHRLFDQLKTPGSAIKEFKAVGHLTHYEIPELIAAAIEDWASTNA